MSQDGKKNYPEKSLLSDGRKLAIQLLSLIDGVAPGAGLLSQQLAEYNIPDPLEKRRTIWHKDLNKRLEELSERLDGFDPRSLMENDNFITAVIETTPLAIKTHLESKRARLANVVLNVAAGRTVNDVLKGKFLGLIDEFSDEHFRMLDVLRSPKSCAELQKYADGNLSGSTFQVISLQLTADGISHQVQHVIYVDLQQHRLTPGDGASLGGGSSISDNNLTDLGQAFLSFISDPLTQI
ncbi:hypothetical protein GR268_34615 [Rhizobium leguminosarum]|nr:hypothetical protein [Rhizobium leguminosarum]